MYDTGNMIVYASMPAGTITARAHKDVVNLRDICAVLLHLGLGMSSPLSTGKEARTLFSLGHGTKAAKPAAVQIHLARGLQSRSIAIMPESFESQNLCCEVFNSARECNDAVLQRIPFEGTWPSQLITAWSSSGTVSTAVSNFRNAYPFW